MGTVATRITSVLVCARSAAGENAAIPPAVIAKNDERLVSLRDVLGDFGKAFS
jgi:hypothetical protein